MCIACLLREMQPEDTQTIAMLDLAFERICDPTANPDWEQPVYGMGQAVENFGFQLSRIYEREEMRNAQASGLSPLEAVVGFGASMYAMGMAIGVAIADHYPNIPRTDYPDKETADAVIQQMRSRVADKSASGDLTVNVNELPESLVALLKSANLIPENFEGELRVIGEEGGTRGLEIVKEENRNDDRLPGNYL